MRAIVFLTVFLTSLLLLSCDSKPTIQKYFVANSENKDFVALDISPTILNVDKTKLTAEQKKALESFDKMNVLVFKLDENNQAQYEVESQKNNSDFKRQILSTIDESRFRKGWCNYKFCG